MVSCGWAVDTWWSILNLSVVKNGFGKAISLDEKRGMCLWIFNNKERIPLSWDIRLSPLRMIIVLGFFCP